MKHSQTKIKIRPKTASVVLEGQTNYCDDLHQRVDVPTLIQKIRGLEADDHRDIYLYLRKYKPKSFFASNIQGTHFNISSLDESVLIGLDRIIRLAIANRQRHQQISQAQIAYDRRYQEQEQEQGQGKV